MFSFNLILIFILINVERIHHHKYIKNHFFACTYNNFVSTEMKRGEKKILIAFFFSHSAMKIKLQLFNFQQWFGKCFFFVYDKHILSLLSKFLVKRIFLYPLPFFFSPLFVSKKILSLQLFSFKFNRTNPKSVAVEKKSVGKFHVRHSPRLHEIWENDW